MCGSLRSTRSRESLLEHSSLLLKKDSKYGIFQQSMKIGVLHYFCLVAVRNQADCEVSESRMTLGSHSQSNKLFDQKFPFTRGTRSNGESTRLNGSSNGKAICRLLITSTVHPCVTNGLCKATILLSRILWKY